MKRTLLTILLFTLTAGGAFAASYQDRAWYYCQHNGHTNATKNLLEVINVTPGTKGALSYISYSFQSWKIASPPSKATLDALDEATVDAWVKEQKAAKDADEQFDKGDAGLLIKATLLELKRENPDLNLPSSTEIKTKFKELKAAQ